MDFTPRLYSGPTDLAHLDAILMAGIQAGSSVYYVHPGDIRWWFYYTFPEDEMWPDIYLWEDGHGRVVAWTLFAMKERALDLFVLPELHGTEAMKSMLAWGIERISLRLKQAGEKALKKDWVYAHDHAQIALLEALGFSRSGKRSPDFHRSLAGPIPEPQLPVGFRVRRCRGLADLESRAAAQHSAFQSDLPMDRYLERFRRYMTSPAYVPEQDIVVEAPDGRIAAFAKTWPHARLGIGLFEPVGVHADFQRLGLGRAVMLAGLQWLQDWGMTSARVGTGADNLPAVRLYESVGFRNYCDVLEYTRDL